MAVGLKKAVGGRMGDWWPRIWAPQEAGLSFITISGFSANGDTAQNDSFYLTLKSTIQYRSETTAGSPRE